MMKSLFLVLVLTFISSNLYAKTYRCTYEGEDEKKGNVTLVIRGNSISLDFGSILVSDTGCQISESKDEVTVECDKDGNAIGVLLERIKGELEGVIISEKADIFAELKC